MAKEKNLFLNVGMGIVVGVLIFAFLNAVFFFAIDKSDFAEESYRLIQFFTFAITGLILLLLAVFIPILFVKLLGFIGGLGSLIEAGIFVRTELLYVIITLGVIIALLVFFVLKTIKTKK